MITNEMMGFTIPEGCADSATFQELREGALARVPDEAGIYMVLSPSGTAVFDELSCGGHFKGRDPAVAVSLLEAKWVEVAPVLYVGKANALRRRLREYEQFGAGRPIGHWGGRYIWQINGCHDMRVTWMSTPGEDPRAVEARLLAEFEAAFGTIPFANLSR